MFMSTLRSHLVGEVPYEHLDAEGHEDGDHDGGGDVLPADAEVQPGPGACHQLDVLAKPIADSVSGSLSKGGPTSHLWRP